MNRRDVLTAGVGLVTMGILKEALAARPCPPTLAGTQAVACPPPTGATQWEWDVPSLQDETDFYSNVMGWTIPGGADSFSQAAQNAAWASSSGYGFGSLHSDTEGDALWAWSQQLGRYGTVAAGSGSTTQTWNDDVLTYYKNNMLSKLDANEQPGAPGTGLGYDHLYVHGLAKVYNDTADAAIIPVLTGIRTRLESAPAYQTLDSGGSLSVATWGARGVGRWALSAAFAAEATGDANWIAVRDNLVRAYETSPDWQDSTNTPAINNGGGMYFESRGQMQFTSGSGGTAAYDGGRRINTSWMTSIAVEAVWRMYVQTGSAILRDRLIKMARYVQHYAHEPSWAFPNAGSRWGHNGDGSRFHIGGGNGSANNAADDCSSDAALVNTMVIGYKLTGDTDMLDFARTLFSRGNRYNPGSPYQLMAQSLNHVFKYVDTVPNPSQRRFQWNKGQLQFCYMIFENGGRPSVLA